MKTILFIHHNGFPGGAEHSLLDLITHLDKTRFKSLAVLPDKGSLQSLFKDNKIETLTLPIPLLRNPLKTPSVLFSLIATIFKLNLKLRKIIKENNIDIIHANSSSACLLCALATLTTKKPLIWHERDLVRHPFLYPFLSLCCNQIIAISKAVSTNLKNQHIKATKIKIIHNGINPITFSTNTKQFLKKDLELPKTNKRILMAAQFVKWKGHTDFINAADKVLEKIPDACFILAGNMNVPLQQTYLKQLQRIIREKKLENKIIFTDFVDDMPSLLKHCTCVVLPSHREPFGRIIIEAMAARRPVISYKGGGPDEIIIDQETGYLIQDGNIENLSTAIMTLLQNPKHATHLGNAGYQRLKQHFHIQQTAEQFTNCLGKL